MSVSDNLSAEQMVVVMNNHADFGYLSSAFVSRCIACGSAVPHCCNGDGRRYTHKIVGEYGFVAGFCSSKEAEQEMYFLRTNADTFHNYYELREV